MQKINMIDLADNFKRYFTFLFIICFTGFISAQHDSLSVRNKEKNVKLISELTKQPEFPGGPRAFMNLLTSEISYEKFENTETKVYVTFLVDKDGKMTDIRVSSPDENIQKELLRIFQKIGLQHQWKPGEVNGEKVRTRMRQPIVIHSAC